MLNCYNKDNNLEVGIDEAGRGPMLGPVSVAAVILPKKNSNIDYSIIKDSKKLSEKKRLKAYKMIINYAIEYSHIFIHEEEIDKINILNATKKGMHEVLNKLNSNFDYIIVDGTQFNYYYRDNDLVPHTCVPAGDDKYYSIAAASIIAKVERDSYIKNLCQKFPYLNEKYGLLKNKGYGTKQHLNAIKKYGISQFHRKSFGICKNYN